MKATVSYEDFGKLDLRVGKIVSASAPEWSHKLLRFEVDFGQEIGKRIMFSGIRKYYEPATLIGKSFVFLVNMEPKKMGEEESQGMMLMADSSTSSGQVPDTPVLLTLMEEVPPGTVVR